jgi:spermidine/putrescine transport system permease protein
MVQIIPNIVKKRKSKIITMKNTKPKIMKKLLATGGIVAAMLLAVVCASRFYSINNKPVLRVFNSGEYIDTRLIDRFEKENNCKIVYETYDSNESMYTKLQSGSEYDILVPSDYMIEKLIKENYLQKIDWSKITEKDGIINSLLHKAYDQDNEYSVPYYWGTVGIVYNKNNVDDKDLKEGWNILKNKKYRGKIYMYDSERDAFMIALKSLGYSMNTTDKSELNKAYNWLVEQNKTMNPVYVGDDVMDNMISGNKDIAVVYSGDGAYIISENKNMSFFVPEQGTNVWSDAMVVTKYCDNTELAYKFINYFLQKDVAKQNTQYIGYDSAVQSVYEYFRDHEYAGNPACAPDTSNPLNEEFRYQKQSIRGYCSELWTKVKSD